MTTEQFEGLRRQAEAMLINRPRDLPVLSAADDALHELQLCQLELEMQYDELRLAQRELERSRERYRELYDRAPIGYVVSGAQGILEANLAAAKLLGTEQAELAGKRLESFVAPDDVEEFASHMRWVLESAEPRVCELALVVRGGERRDTRLQSMRASASPEQWRTAIVDVSEERRLERQLVDSARREAIGPIARGLAHDVSHVLMAIVGDADRVLAQLPPRDAVRPMVDELKAFALRGGSIVRQVLETARRPSGAVESSNLNEVVIQWQPLLNRLTGNRVRLRFELRAAKPWVGVKRGELEQLLSNLASNACDAMGEDGELSIETREGSPDEGSSSSASNRDYVVLSVTDTGSGMSPALQARIFEPFYTTKPGRGTGLGMPTVYGIVKRAGGELRLRSELGKGTSIDVYLPRQGSAADRPSSPPGFIANGSVLIVETDPLVNLAASGVLEQAGYDVVQAENAQVALRVLRAAGSPIRLVLSDAGLPDMDGSELLRQVRETFPKVQTVLMSADSREELSRRGRLDPGVPVLEKPFEHHALIDVVRRALAPQRTGRRPTILVVEDDAAARQAYDELLCDEGFGVVAVSSAAEALTWFAENGGEVAALVSDMNLSGMNGADLVREVRASASVPVVFVSGSADDDADLRELLSEPKTELLLKPVEISVLAHTLRCMIDA